MPHKRAKLSTRRNEQAKVCVNFNIMKYIAHTFLSGRDLPPPPPVPLVSEVIPKGVARILQAESIRQAFRDKRSRDAEDEPDGNERERKRRRKEENAVEQRKKIEIKVCFCE